MSMPGAHAVICTAAAKPPQHPERAQRMAFRCCEMPCSCRSPPAAPILPPIRPGTLPSGHQQQMSSSRLIRRLRSQVQAVARAACRPGMRQAVLRTWELQHSAPLAGPGGKVSHLCLSLQEHREAVTKHQPHGLKAQHNSYRLQDTQRNSGQLQRAHVTGLAEVRTHLPWLLWLACKVVCPGWLGWLSDSRECHCGLLKCGSCNRCYSLVGMLMCLVGWPADCQSKAHAVHPHLLSKARVRNPLQLPLWLGELGLLPIGAACGRQQALDECLRAPSKAQVWVAWSSQSLEPGG